MNQTERTFLAAAVVCALALSAAAAADQAVHDVSATPSRAEGEPTVAVNPLDPQNVIVGGNQWQPLTNSNIGNVSIGPGGVGDCAAWASHDGGVTWKGGLLNRGGLGKPIVLPPLPDAPVLNEVPREVDDPGNFFSIDQNAVFDRHGNAWYQCINDGGGNLDIVVNVYHSADGGTTWDEPVAAYRESREGIQFDRPFLAIDRSGGPRDGTLYLTFETIFYQAWLPAVYAKKSTDKGKTWGPTVRVDAGLQETMWDPRQYPVMGARGVLYVVYNTAVLVTPYPNDPQITPLGIKVARSTDGANTFERFVVDTNVRHAASPDEAFVYFTETVTAIAADREHYGRLAVAWPDTGTPNGEARVLMRYSLDAGETWSERIDVADDPPGRGNQHDHVALTYLPHGRLLVVWRDRRASGGSWQSPWEVFARVFEVARDGKLTAGKVVMVTTSPRPPTTDHHGTMPTEYLGVTAGREGVSFAWDEMRGQFPDIVYRRLPLSAF